MPSYAVVFTDPAADDLERIREHIGRDNPGAANRVAVQLIAACDRLEYLPERGRPGVLIGTRELAALWPYVIVYRVSASVVEVLRIFHGAQDRGGP